MARPCILAAVLINCPRSSSNRCSLQPARRDLCTSPCCFHAPCRGSGPHVLSCVAEIQGAVRHTHNTQESHPHGSNHAGAPKRNQVHGLVTTATQHCPVHSRSTQAGRPHCVHYTLAVPSPIHGPAVQKAAATVYCQEMQQGISSICNALGLGLQGALQIHVSMTHASSAVHCLAADCGQSQPADPARATKPQVLSPQIPFAIKLSRSNTHQPQPMLMPATSLSTTPSALLMCPIPSLFTHMPAVITNCLSVPCS